MNPLAIPHLPVAPCPQYSVPAVVFTTIDGFPLAGRTKRLDEILPAAELLQRRGIPLVLCSRKTRREIEVRSGRLVGDSPFIYEDGGGVRVPRGHFPFPIEGEVDGGEIIIPLGTPYPQLRAALRDLRRELRVSATGFGDLSAAGIANLAGLSIGEADVARRREFDEPFAFDDPREPRAAEFLRAIEARGLRWTRGRFFHIHGDNDQSRAVRLLTGLYRRVWPTLRTVAIWDVLHDPSLLQAIDVPVLLKRDDAGRAEAASPSATGRAGDPASEGWNRTVLEIFGK